MVQDVISFCSCVLLVCQAYQDGQQRQGQLVQKLQGKLMQYKRKCTDLETKVTLPTSASPPPVALASPPLPAYSSGSTYAGAGSGIGGLLGASGSFSLGGGIENTFTSKRYVRPARPFPSRTRLSSSVAPHLHLHSSFVALCNY